MAHDFEVPKNHVSGWTYTDDLLWRLAGHLSVLVSLTTDGEYLVLRVDDARTLLALREEILRHFQLTMMKVVK